MVLSDVAIGGLTKAMDALSSQLKEAMSFADNAQRASLALGTTFKSTNEQLGGTMKGLRGDITQKFGAAIAGMEAGLQGNTAGVAKLINQQQLTNTNSAKTAAAFAGLEVSLNTSRDQTNTLSESLIETGAEYQISTDKLVDAIDALKSTFPAQALAGMGDKVMGAVTKLQGELGPQLGGQLNSVMKMVMDTSMEGYEKLTKLGISDVRERLAAAQDASEAQSILKDAFVTASDSFKTVAGDASKGFFQIGVASEVFGSESIKFTEIANNLGERVKQEGADAADFGQTLANLKAEILTPFTEALAKFYPIIIKSFEALSLVARRVVQQFSKFVESTLPAADKIFKTVTLKLLDFAITGFNLFSKLKKSISLIVDDVWPKFKDTLMSLQTLFHFAIIVPLELVKVTFTSFVNGLDTLYAALLFLVKGIYIAIEKITFGAKSYTDEIDFVNKQLTKVGERMVGRSEDIKENFKTMAQTPEKSAAQFAAAIKEINNDPNGLGNKYLLDLRKSFENGEKYQRETSVNTKNIDTKTPEIADTGPSLLEESAMALGQALESMLGVGKNTTSEEMLEELRVANMQRAAAPAAAGLGFVPGGIDE
tara:strand:+ start:1949 stop:3739 length:1791 start_codon:yes stop_codon:yes gene_type:complete